jgi:hypothetical protein
VRRRARRRPRSWDADLPWGWLRVRHAATARVLDRLEENGWSGVDRARILGALDRVRDGSAPPDAQEELFRAIVRDGEAACLHPSGQRELPGSDPARHNLGYGQVMLGRTVPDPRGTVGLSTRFALDHDVLRTSMLVIGPPGAGKTHGVARPVVEHLALSGLANRASVVVVDVKGDDFADHGWFDVTLDPLDPRSGLDLYGGTADADVAADRLAGALLPPRAGDDLAYFMDASKNALYGALFPFRLAFGRWPLLRELLALLRGEQGTTDLVRTGLNGRRGDPLAKEARRRLDERRQQLGRRHDPAVSLIERLQLLDRPSLVALLEHPGPVFRMPDINRPIRVRVVLREAQFPEAARILARLVIAQFVNTASSVDTDRHLFKALVIDEAGRFVDDYVARGMQTLRSSNAGLILLTQTVSDFPEHVWGTVFGSAGCKVVFGGIGVLDAEVFSRWLGDDRVTEVTRQAGVQESRSSSSGWSIGTSGPVWHRGEHHGRTTSAGRSIRQVERPRWTVSDLTTGVPPGHCIAALTRSTGERFGPSLVDLRG